MSKIHCMFCYCTEQNKLKLFKKLLHLLIILNLHSIDLYLTNIVQTQDSASRTQDFNQEQIVFFFNCLHQTAIRVLCNICVLTPSIVKKQPLQLDLSNRHCVCYNLFSCNGKGIGKGQGWSDLQIDDGERENA